jgi:chromosome segregation protein
MKKEEELRQELEDLRSFEIEGAKEKEILCEKIKSSKEGIEETIRFIADKEVLAKEIASDLKSISKKIKKRRDEITSLRKIVSKLKDEKTAIEAGLQDSKAEKILKGIRELESQLSSLEKEKDGKRNQISLNKSKIEEILHPRFSELKSELKGIFSSKKELAEQLKAINEEKTNLESSLSVLKEKKKEVRDEIKNLNDKRDFLIKGINKIERKNSALRDELNDIAKRMEHAKIEKARLETRLEDINESLKQYADLEIKLDKRIDTAKLEDEITKMEVEMASLEPINMRAIEDFEAVKEKFEKLNQRIEKLLNERQAINKLMEEIEHRKKAIFMEVFENISANFRRIFSQLSPGGTAELLLDEQNPLEGGLQIQTKPAGKNVQLLEAMSGGEKTLTAVSFIFAIQRYSPAPFYVLDEVDMFLDDDNVRKVSELIKDSAREAQFVVVSLKDSLMSSADQLFGVSNEDGVSKIIGVELEEVGA